MAIYQDIASALEQEITSRFQPGEYLPSEQQLAGRFQVNRHTLRRAVDDLVAKGVVQRQHGRGIMVNSLPVNYPIHHQSCFTENLARIGRSLHTRVLSCETIMVPDFLHTLFSDAATTAPLVHIRTLRHMNEQPATLIDHYVNLGRYFPTIKGFMEGSLHSFLYEQLGVSLKRGRTLLHTRMPDSHEARYLQLGVDIPVMRIQTCNYLVRETSRTELIEQIPADTPVEVSISVSRGDLFQYVLEPGHDG
ncbi:MAG: phosphonate metabolism transcriptional regulator PhnF [Endozoicomonas sp.]